MSFQGTRMYINIDFTLTQETSWKCWVFFSFSLSFFLCVKQMTRSFPNCLVIRQSSPWLLLGKVLWVSPLTHIYRHASFLHIEFLPSQHKQAFFGSGHDVLFQNDFTESRRYLDVFTFLWVKIFTFLGREAYLPRQTFYRKKGVT